MVYDTFKKIGLSFLVILFCVSISNAQNKIKQFSNNYSDYLDELSEFMSASENSDLKSNYKKFKKISLNNVFIDSNKDLIITISNKMLKKRYKASTHFNNFILSLIDLNQKNFSDNQINDWLFVVDNIVNDFSSKRLLLYLYFTSDLINDKLIRKTRTTNWGISSYNFNFKIDISGPYIYFNDLNIICSSDGGSMQIFNASL